MHTRAWNPHRRPRPGGWLVLLVLLIGPLPPAHPTSASLRRAPVISAWSAPHRVPAVQTLRQFATPEPILALTFDAGADRGSAAAILDILAQQQVPASFGITGRWAAQNPDLIQRMVHEGHHLINHSWDHARFTTLSSAERAAQLQRTEALIRAQAQVSLAPYFRPPYGDYDDAVLADLHAQGYTLNVLWTVDSLGWAGRTAVQISDRVVQAARPGAIVLLHVGEQSQDVAALPDLIHRLRVQGYRFATVVALVAGWLPPPEQYFPQTGQLLRGDFRTYWQRNGGLPIFGYPLSTVVQARTADAGQVLTVQYLERQRFEAHPEHPEGSYHVQLGRLGVEVLAQQGRDWQTFPKADPATPHYFGATGHAIAAPFWTFWRSHGLELGDRAVSEREALALWGYPISAAQLELNRSGDEVLTQWFERARLEYHPHQPSRVVVGRLGAEVHEVVSRAWCGGDRGGGAQPTTAGIATALPSAFAGHVLPVQSFHVHQPTYRRRLPPSPQAAQLMQTGGRDGRRQRRGRQSADPGGVHRTPVCAPGDAAAGLSPADRARRGGSVAVPCATRGTLRGVHQAGEALALVNVGSNSHAAVPCYRRMRWTLRLFSTVATSCPSYFLRPSAHLASL